MADRRFDSRDWAKVCEFIGDLYRTRKTDPNRTYFDKVIKDIDRQIAMRPDAALKVQANGTADTKKAWMPESELPNQAQTLEILTADARHMMFPGKDPWFNSHALCTDEYLNRVDFKSLVAGDENEVPSVINQDNADILVTGTMMYWQRQYNFSAHMDLINAEAFKYGLTLGRARLVTKKSYMNATVGNAGTNVKFPMLIPVSIKNAYPDTNKHTVLLEGYDLSASTIFVRDMSLEDLKQAANKGKNDPNDMDGGWMPANLKSAQANKDGNIKVLEWSGDLVVPRKSTPSIFLSNVIVSMVEGANAPFRFRFNPYNFTDTIYFPYHREHIETPYATSPLMKGWAIQKAATDALNRVMECGSLNTQPPMSYDKDDPYFAQNGGPQIFPGASWATTGKIEVHEIGDPSAMFNIYAGLLSQYSDVTGVNAPRLGAQTVSHTTAYAKQIENSRGTLRTVDYVNSTLEGPLTQWLYMAYAMGRDVFKSATIYLDKYGGYVDMKKDYLPEQAVFYAEGADETAMEQAKTQSRMSSVQTVLQMEQLRFQAQQAGFTPVIDFTKLYEQVLKDGGWTDVNAIEQSGAGVSTQPQGQPPMEVGPVQDVAAPGTALSNLAIAAR
jgi:hypothetical protein